MKASIISLAALATLVIAGYAKDANASTQQDQAFVNSCIQGAVGEGAPYYKAKSFCTCAIDKIHETNSFDRAFEVCLARFQ